ncbi:Metalloenzyme, LuxS/M16 peptidase-like protein [Polychytrium aggregatum]|uniref:Metalloenzyme, LuxS/M16 peptidase-like protein n=1 Tax=Polychytrium aggregatum TaxID=110093 RepID=UPI0022FE8DA4|nr:Metalloenzyme, LuxS/M16 peptidase-like protein [Polychytrium aggregatum]KAI9207536.1 Metalloenzyme, LuxS/M16 peptidase-like protein [Polychytrium aggregatum]
MSLFSRKKPSPPAPILPPGVPTVITTLKNGIKVASVETPGHFVSFGAYINTGTRNETIANSGCSHILDRMTFKSTRDFTTEQLVQQLEALGGNISAHSSRDTIMYQSSVFRPDLPKVVNIVSQILRHAKILPEELEDTRITTMYELEDLQMRPEMILPEHLHRVAFQHPAQDNTHTLGNSLFCSPEQLNSLTPEAIRNYKSTWYTPERITFAGVGMEHQALVELIEQHFGDMSPASPETLALQNSLIRPAVYSGGIEILDTSSNPPPPNPDIPVLTNVYVAFEAPSLYDPDVYPLAILASLMGGGGSFSAGGPGKGMYTRLYTQVLNRYHWVENCNTVNYSYADTGLFGIAAAVPPFVEAHRAILPIICDQMVRMTMDIGREELSRAKNQLKSNLLMNLEMRMVELEDIGKQVVLQGKRVDASEMCRRIDSIQAADIKRVARRVVLGEDIRSPLDFGDDNTRHWTRTGQGQPTVVVQGPIFDNDPLHKASETLRDWQLGRSQAA